MEHIDGRMLIGGELVESAGGAWLDSVDPATEEIIGRVPAGSPEDIGAAVEAASDAFPEWAGKSMQERADILREYGRRLRSEHKRILEIEVRDTGNSVSKLRHDVVAAVRGVEYFAGLGTELKGETIPAGGGSLHYSVREPYGVVGRIVPFNHPILFAAKFAAPLMAGNCIVIKPSEQSPLSASVLGEIVRDTLPPGVVNIVTGDGRGAGDPLVRHPAVKRISFIGSVPTGLAIQRAAAEVAVKHVSLELGGKNPLIVFPDADPEEVSTAAVAGMNFGWQGQSCGSTSRLLVPDALYSEIVSRVAAKVDAIVMGDPGDESVQAGPMNSRGQLDKTLRYIDIAHEDGARLVAGGVRPTGPQFERGYWVRPTVFADVTSDMRIFREEVFGPILSIVRYSDVEEAMRLANDVEYGLTASIWTNDLTAAMRAAQRVRAGYVWVNDTSRHFLGTGFGGMNNSGVGREECFDEMLSYTELKTVHVRV
ncbi:aldehyde dehydrogenase family protein [Streptomyces sp. NBC_01239]|uniref:aldehyde dehydrogenase family protein n=1 Tax=Streptomyces sp. NBC_01239 TaxID=2903792 RepID=UPI0022559EF0|nr:aldehyde dehydrogenase family protein [Streptomyces sp. NBC_01239]MCX4817977.1 aldehyde dehydrogenase family protein [Streptomyces sp. NBC_01239]